MWKERNIDLWSLNHLIFGCTLAIILKIFNIDFFYATIIAIIIFLGWETIEIYTKTFETTFNRFSDVFIELFGFVLFYKVKFSLMVYFILFAVYGLLELSGYYSRVQEDKKDKLNYVYMTMVVVYCFFGLFLLIK